MTETDVIEHWRKGAKESMRLAKLAHDDGSYALALFHCHLAVEKAMKAQFMQEHQKEPPPTHNLVLLARQLKHPRSEDETRKLDYLTQYAIAARYDDPLWAEREATEANSDHWLTLSDAFLSSLLP